MTIHREILLRDGAKWRAALERIATPEAFYVATAKIDPEAAGRMWFAQFILDGHSLETAEDAAKQKARNLVKREP